jgi:hypothetical protein
MINLIAMLIILAIFSIFFGYITKDIFIGLGSGFFADNSLFIHPTHEIMLDTEFAVPTLFKLLPLVFTISLSVLAIILSEFLGNVLINFKLSRLGYNIFGFFNQRFLIELFYNKYITGLVLKLGGQTTKVIDKGSVELLGPFGLEKGLINLSKSIASLDTGLITNYALFILIGLIFYIGSIYISLFDYSLILLMFLSLFSIMNMHSNSVKQKVQQESSIIGGFSYKFTPFKIDVKHFSTSSSHLVSQSPSDDENRQEGDPAQSPYDDENSQEGDSAQSPYDDENSQEGDSAQSPYDDGNRQEGDPAQSPLDGGYASDPDGAYHDDMAEAAMNQPVNEVRSTHIHSYIGQATAILTNPEDIDLDEESDDQLYQEYVRRNQALRVELRRRKDAGEMMDSPSPAPAPEG